MQLTPYAVASILTLMSFTYAISVDDGTGLKPRARAAFDSPTHDAQVPRAVLPAKPPVQSSTKIPANTGTKAAIEDEGVPGDYAAAAIHA